MKTKALIAHIVQWMGAYARREHMHGFVVGVSGGVDSAVVSSLCARTGLPTLCLFMPIEQASAEATRAKAHLKHLKRSFDNVRAGVLSLGHTYTMMRDQLARIHKGGEQELALANLKSRLRLNALYYFATLNQQLVVGTGNRTEKAVGFFAKYGDVDMDLNPIGELSKSEVYELAAELKIDPRIRRAEPTDGLWTDGRTDRDQLGAGYGELEWALEIREAERDTKAMKLDHRQLEVLGIYDERHKENAHKLRPAPRCPIPFSLRIPAARRTMK